MLFTTVLATLVASAAAAKDSRTFAVLHHYGKGPLTTCRADPIISPGGPSSHVHTVMGASNFGVNATGETLRQSSCTTALLKADLSSYWFPTLYFQDPATNLLEPVELFYMNAYYFFEPTNDDIKAFPVGLQMVSGNAQMRTAPSKTSGANQLDPSQGTIQPVQITCPRSNFNPPSWPANSDGSIAGIQDPNNKGSGIGFPFQDCDGYASPMRVDVHFPSCYNPAAGLTNYKENMQFPSSVSGNKQDCPKGWIHTPHIFFETYWNTHALLPRFQSLIGKASPFVFSNGDVTGYSAHADFISGWAEDELQNIIDNCDAGDAGMDKCPGLKYGLNDPSTSCNIQCPIDEVVTGTMEKLPGNNPLTGWSHGTGTGTGSGTGSSSGSGAAAPPAASSSASSSAPSASAKPASGASNSGSGASSNDQPPPAQSQQHASSSSAAAAAPPPPAQSTTLVPVVVSSPPPAAANNAAVSSQSVPPPAPTAQAQAVQWTTVYDTVTVWETKTVYDDDSTPAPTDLPSKADATSATKPADIAGFQYVGCYKDSINRAISGEVLPNLGLVSNTNCVTYCASKGWTVAGTEYGGECYCGDALSPLEKLDETSCSTACKGDAGETCGGDWALTVYTKGGAAPSNSTSTGAGAGAGAAKRHAGHLHLHHARVPSRRHRR